MNLKSRLLTLICLLTLNSLWCAESAHAAIRAGASKKTIVPPFPTQMGGFFDRSQNFEGVLDELLVRSLVLDDGKTKLVFLGSDLMAIDAEMVRLIRDGITQSTLIPATNILICCTHNHSAPSYYQKTALGKDEEEPSLKRFLVKQFTDAAIEAAGATVPARIGFGAGSLSGITRNRQQKNDLIDPQVGVLRVEELEGRKTIATLFNFTGHPVILGSKNLLLSGEYPGSASRAVEHLVGGVAIFTQGACGDITMNRDGAPELEIERLGRTVAGEVVKTSGLIKLGTDASLKAASQTLSLPARVLPSLEESTAALEKGKAALEAAKQQNALPALIQQIEDKNRVHTVAIQRMKAIIDESDPSKMEKELKAEIQVLQVGDVIFGAIPGEIFVEYALELRSRVKQETNHSFCLVGYANGYLGYIVTPRAVETGGYEASVTRLNGLAGRAMTESAMDLLHQISSH